MRVRAEHWQCLLNAAEENPEIITNRYSGSQGRGKHNALWQSLTSKLNSLGYGEKNVEEWKKTLTDWKSKTKGKAAKFKKEINKTGGGGYNEQQLSNLECRLINLMGMKTIDGDKVPELGFGMVAEVNEAKSANFAATEAPTASVKVSQDHDYICTTSKENIRKRKLPKDEAPKRLRPTQALRVSNELLDVNRQALDILKNISSDIHAISDGINRIASVLEKHFS